MNFLIVLLMSFSAQAKESWFCTEQSSAMEGENFKACGTGYGELEEIAKSHALDEAQREFNSFCRISTKCKGYSVSVVPGRVTCEEDKRPTIFVSPMRWKCYRMLTYIIDRSHGD